MLKDLFTRKKQYLSHFFDALDLNVTEQFFDILRECKGLIVFTGVGKSGLIAKKIAVTMTSVGSRAVYLSPTNALHGDLGMLTNQDLFIMLSKSGESDELLHLIPFLRNKGVKLLGIVSNENSRLARACDFFVTLPVEKELCPFNLAPTTSSTIQLIFGDIMAIALMNHKKMTIDQYAMNHPAGSIGKRLTIKVQDMMLKGSQLPICSEQDKLVDILVELSNKRCGCILIVDKQNVLQGIFTDGDLSRALLKHGKPVLDLTMDQLMTKTPRTIQADKLAWDAMKLMEADPKHAIQCLAVIDENKQLQGLIKLHDLVQAGLS